MQLNRNDGRAVREPARPARREAIAYLVRHAHTDAVGHRLSGRTESIGLSEAGHAEAHRLGLAMAPLPLAAVYTSPMSRAVQTARAIASYHRLAPEPLSDLQEIDFGAWSGCSFAELAADRQWHTFNHHRARARIPGGERLRTVQRRMVNAVRTLGRRHARQHFVMVSHCDVIRLALLAFASLSIDDYLAFDIAPASITTVSIAANGRVSIVRVNVPCDLWSPGTGAEPAAQETP